MSVRVQTVGATQLEPGTRAAKRNFTLATTIGGATGQVVGGYNAQFIKLPASWAAGDNQVCLFLGGDTNRNGNYVEANETGFTIGGPNASGGFALRPRYRANTIGVGNTAMTPMASGGTYLLLRGTTNRGTNASPAWIEWIAYCDVATGTVHSWTQAHNTTFTSSTTFSVLETIFAAAGTANTRTPVNTELEHVAWIDGDFPWDTGNDGSVTGSVAGQGRPHHDAIRALCGYGGTNYTYETLVAAQNAGTLPAGWTNLRTNGDTPARPGRATVTEWFKLASLADLANRGSNSSNSLAVVDGYNGLSGGLTNGAAALAPAHWAPAAAPPTITDPLFKFIAGRGTVARTFSGTYDALNTTALERRWVVTGTSTPAAGRDWADIAGISGGNWSLTETVPIGHYDLVVRDKNNPDRIAISTDWLSGTRVLMHGQSAMALSIRAGFGSNPLGNNNLNVAVASGAQGIVMRLDNMYADGGAGGTYKAPEAVFGRMRSGETPAIGHGAILFLNEWHALNPGHPLMICNMAINTHGQDIDPISGIGWNGNTKTDPSAPATWRFLGPLTPAVPNGTDGSNSGVMNYYAHVCGGYVDLHIIMWSPGMGETTGAAGDTLGTGTGRTGYRAAVDARFTASASAPWLVLPPWRFHRALPDVNAGPNVRERHIQFISELGARGIRGPSWQHIVQDGTNSGHPAGNTSTGVPDAGNPISDANSVGQGRLGRLLGWATAWAFNRRIKAHGPRLVGAWWRDAGVRNVIEAELARVCRTINGAAIHPGQFWISESDNGATFVNTGFTVALSTDGTRAVLTKTSGAWPVGTRVEVNWVNPFSPDEMANESNAEANLGGLLFDSLTYSGGTNLAAGVRPGNPLQGTSRSGAGNAGVLVTTRGTPKVVTTELFTGSRTLNIGMRQRSTGTVLVAPKPVTITAS